jgi:hypothetical protein
VSFCLLILANLLAPQSRCDDCYNGDGGLEPCSYCGVDYGVPFTFIQSNREGSRVVWNGILLNIGAALALGFILGRLLRDPRTPPRSIRTHNKGQTE